MTVYEFNPTEEMMLEYKPYLIKMSFSDFKDTVRDLKRIFVNNPLKIIYRPLEYYVDNNYSIDVVYSNLVPFLLMNNLTRIFKFKGYTSNIYKIIIVFKLQDGEKDLIDIAEEILTDINRTYSFNENDDIQPSVDEVDDLVEDLEEIKW